MSEKPKLDEIANDIAVRGEACMCRHVPALVEHVRSLTERMDRLAPAPTEEPKCGCDGTGLVENRNVHPPELRDCDCTKPPAPSRDVTPSPAPESVRAEVERIVNTITCERLCDDSHVSRAFAVDDLIAWRDRAISSAVEAERERRASQMAEFAERTMDDAEFRNAALRERAEKAERGRDELASVVGQALMEMTLAPDESLVQPREHALISAAHGLRLRAEKAEAESTRLREDLRLARERCQRADELLVWGMDKAETSLQRKIAMNDALTEVRVVTGRAALGASDAQTGGA